MPIKDKPNPTQYDKNSEHLLRSREFVLLLEQMGFDHETQLKFADELRGAKQPSIDAFLQERGDEFLELGKTAIAASLIPCENLQELLYMEHELPSTARDQRWYEYLLNLLGTYNGFDNNNLSIITFNYDRSLEYFIFHTAKHRFNLNDQDAIKLLATIPIVHVYGQLGKLDFLDPNGRAYIPALGPSSIQKCVDEMHLMYEKREESEFIASNKLTYELIQNAHTLVFLGFGYHEKNLERLNLRGNFRARHIITVFYRQKEGEKLRASQLVGKYASRPNEGGGLNIRSEVYSALEFFQNTNHFS